MDAVDRLFPNGIPGVHDLLVPQLDRVLRAMGVAKIEGYCAEDPSALARLEPSVLWIACNLGLARCTFSLTMRGQLAPRPDPSVGLTPWAEVRGAAFTAATSGGQDPETKLTLQLARPSLELSAIFGDAVANRRRPEQLQTIAGSIIGHLRS